MLNLQATSLFEAKQFVADNLTVVGTQFIATPRDQTF